MVYYGGGGGGGDAEGGIRPTKPPGGSLTWHGGGRWLCLV